MLFLSKEVIKVGPFVLYYVLVFDLGPITRT